MRRLVFAAMIFLAGCSGPPPTPEEQQKTVEFYKERIIVVTYENGVNCYIYSGGTVMMSCVKVN